MSAERDGSGPGSREGSPSPGQPGRSPSSDNNVNADAGVTSTRSSSPVLAAEPAKTNSPVSDSPSSSRGPVTRWNIRKREEIEEVKDKYLSMDLQSKRKLYRGSYVTLGDIKTWPDYFNEDLKQKSTAEKEVEVNNDLNQKISLFQGDITTLEIDAIVNAANESLLGGSGVDGAIHRAAGHHLRSECETLRGCQPGQAKITCGYKLAAKYVIHTVGPRGEKPKVLQQCYTNCLNLVKEHKLTSVAFPCISTGVFGYPNGNAASVALSAVRQWLETEEYARHVERVIFCLFLKVDVDAYNLFMPIYFPIESAKESNADKSPTKSEMEESPSPSSEDGKCDSSKEETGLRKD
ncbi:hypothetical protein BsWGS_14648 [Bradybaena similaris]